MKIRSSATASRALIRFQRRVDRLQTIAWRAGLRKQPVLPPPSIRFMNEDDALFLRAGDELVDDLTRFAGMHPRSWVLDVGSGYGRFAHALLRRGGFSGRYLGVDILPRHVKWSVDHLSRIAEPEVRFSHLDIANDRYNPKGKLRPEDVRFETGDGSVDCVLLSSVFTHMYESQILAYLKEIRRVLRPSGRALISFFLLNESSRAGEEAKTTAYPMPFALNDHCRYANAKDPLHAIGYDQAWLIAQLEGLGLRLAVPPLLGKWCGRANGYRYQDFLVLEGGRSV